jgi:hypothetical protein
MNGKMKKQFAVVLFVLCLGMTGSIYCTADASEESDTFMSSIQCPCSNIPYHKEAYSVNFGVHDGLIGENWITIREVVRIPGVPWLQLHFSDYNLGMRSYFTMTSGKDGAQQHVDTSSIRYCRNSSAFFNGDTVTMDLHVAPGDRDIFLSIEEITVGEWVGDQNGRGSKSLCDQDDRVSSDDPRVGRLVPIGCTGWITSNGAHLTAGHCDDIDMQTLEFNVPSSLPDGTIQHPGPEDQYSVDTASIVSHDDGTGQIGDDWTVFTVDPNTNTGLLPVHAQGAFYRMSRDYNPTTVRVSGYGTDDEPPGSTGGRNADSQTLQTDSGSFLGEVVEGPSDAYIEYIVDTMPASSGSPVIVHGTTVTIGIHTNGGCDPPDFGNTGTSFENDGLENAIQTFPVGANVMYVDKDHPVSQEDGTVFRPYDTVAEAVTAVPSGGNILIVIGSYAEQITINKDVTLVAPVGVVVIG